MTDLQTPTSGKPTTDNNDRYSMYLFGWSQTLQVILLETVFWEKNLSENGFYWKHINIISRNCGRAVQVTQEARKDWQVGWRSLNLHLNGAYMIPPSAGKTFSFCWRFLWRYSCMWWWCFCMLGRTFACLVLHLRAWWYVCVCGGTFDTAIFWLGMQCECLLSNLFSSKKTYVIVSLTFVNKFLTTLTFPNH